VSACPKHFVGNECETNRKTSNTIVDEKALRELYAYAFQVLLKDPTEGLEMGYRALNKPAPLFPFGYGKPYTDFSLQGLTIKPTVGLSTADLTVATSVTNIGPVAGREVIQIYVDGVLEGFQMVFLTPGENRVVEVTLDKYAFSEWSSKEGSWIIKAQTYSIDFRQDATTVVSSTTHSVEASLTWNGGLSPDW
jgi:beta-glucosidase